MVDSTFKNAMPRYRPLLTGANWMSYQNTVAVKNEDDTWWLGYIQDIDMDGERALIHFDSTQVTERWIHMGSVWTLPYYWESLAISDKDDDDKDSRECYVALRDEDNGPFRFRPASWLSHLVGCYASCDLFNIITQLPSDCGNCDEAMPTVNCEIVDKAQVTGFLPPRGPPLLKRPSGLLYTKHFIPFPEAHNVLRDASDKFRIIKHLRDAVKPPLGIAVTTVYQCRFFLRVQPDGCMFILASRTWNARRAWNAPAALAPEVTLASVLQTHLSSRVDLPSIGSRRALPQEAGLEGDTLRTNHQLTPSLLSDILAHLDVHSQMRAKRVCALWQQLLDSPRMTENVSMTFESCWQLQSDSDNCFKAATLMSRSITSATTSLTVLRFPSPVCKDHISRKPENIPRPSLKPLKHPAALLAMAYKDVCQAIVLFNWTVGDLFGPTMHYAFECKQYGPQELAANPLHANEQELMRHLTFESREMDIDKLQISIPRLLMRCSEGRTRMAARFMHALNENFPPVTGEMLAKVTAVHARWVRTLDYPEQWESIRNYICLFSGFHPDGALQMWDNVDLRLLDVSELSKLAIYGINELFRSVRSHNTKGKDGTVSPQNEATSS
ncbi:uncharacterized protein LOC129599277 isoform X2 [Paramacrobiotus metropolitanus]|uniref:uncharacterized protein LOC129599277 isoform X2 n=1 Tax=Paramacrobiotus metropolitanus TaxID=2943436 RepID=UPI0024459C8B|nr:uncharacterized protein LOC129599277 isoform X2 [Paramacrobiotus metropolitanus]